MKIKNLFLVLLLVCLVPLVLSMAKKSSGDEYDSIVLSFAKGDYRLSDTHTAMLRKLVQKAQAKGNISKVEVAGWSDNEHPKSGTLSQASRTLADKRLKTVKDALHKDLGNMNYIAFYNMAESANKLERLFDTAEAELDAVFAKKESGALDRQDFTIIKRDGRPSSVVIVLKVHKR